MGGSMSRRSLPMAVLSSPVARPTCGHQASPLHGGRLRGDGCSSDAHPALTSVYCLKNMHSFGGLQPPRPCIIRPHS